MTEEKKDKELGEKELGKVAGGVNQARPATGRVGDREDALRDRSDAAAKKDDEGRTGR